LIGKTVVLTDGRKFDCDIIVADLIAFERHFNVDAMTASPRLEHWAFLCWAVCNRDGRFPGTFEEWVPLVEDLPEPPKEQAPKDLEPSPEEPSEQPSNQE